VTFQPVTFLLPYQPPYHWRAMLAFLAARAVPAIEEVTADGWHRSLDGPGDQAPGIVSVTDEPERQALRVRLTPSLAGCGDALQPRLAAMFDTGCDPQAVGAALGGLAAAAPGLRLPGTLDPFELAVRAILGQQVTVAAARTLAARMVARYGTPLAGGGATPPVTVTHCFPSAGRIASEGAAAIDELGRLGIIRTRGAAILAVATEMHDGRLQLEPGAPVTPAVAALIAIRGIGPWTAHYIAMRALGWRDAFPPGDVAVLRAMSLTSAAAATRAAEAWRPWRAYAVLHLWRSLSISAR
jgi:AraC family transcriptional regulator of adaptative response / DNA-3-methyladenine glycosylase II